MLIGIPKEIKVHEYRVGMSPAAARELIKNGHQILVETGAGNGIGSDDAAYVAIGARIVSTAAKVFEDVDMIVKVKEPQPNECAMLQRGQLIFAYLHLAPDPLQAELLMRAGCTAIAYETVTDRLGGLPLLAPMSEVAGRMSIQVGAISLQKTSGGRGILLGGVPGVPPARVVILGGGISGTQAAQMAIGMGANVTILDRSLQRLRELDNIFNGRLHTVYSTTQSVEESVIGADLVIGAVLIPGAAAPKLVRREHLKQMRPGTVLVDISIDQGGCFETSRVTTHQNPTYEVDGVLHYCVGNMPGAVPLTSTIALNNATLPFALALANKGWTQACNDDPYLLAGLNVHEGKITCKAVADALNMNYEPADACLG